MFLVANKHEVPVPFLLILETWHWAMSQGPYPLLF